MDKGRPLGKIPAVVEPGELGPGPWKWIVTWGALLHHGWHSVVVEAFDADDALVIAREAHPDRPAPRTALLARQVPVGTIDGTSPHNPSPAGE